MARNMWLDKVSSIMFYKARNSRGPVDIVIVSSLIRQLIGLATAIRTCTALQYCFGRRSTSTCT